MKITVIVYRCTKKKGRKCQYVELEVAYTKTEVRRFKITRFQPIVSRGAFVEWAKGAVVKYQTGDWNRRN